MIIIPKTELKIKIGYSILKIFTNFKYFDDENITKIPDPTVNIFINVESASIL